MYFCRNNFRMPGFYGAVSNFHRCVCAAGDSITSLRFSAIRFSYCMILYLTNFLILFMVPPLFSTWWLFYVCTGLHAPGCLQRRKYQVFLCLYGLQHRVSVILGETNQDILSPLKQGNMDKGETNPGGMSPLKREDTGRGETNPDILSPLKRNNTDEGETNPGGTSPLKWENTDEGETNPGGTSPLKREDTDEGETNPSGTSPLKRENTGRGETNPGEASPEARKTGDMATDGNQLFTSAKKERSGLLAQKVIYKAYRQPCQGGR